MKMKNRIKYIWDGWVQRVVPSDPVTIYKKKLLKYVQLQHQKQRFMVVFYTASLGYNLFYTIFYKFATSDNIFKWNLGKHGNMDKF